MGKQEWFEGHRIAKNTVYFIVKGIKPDCPEPVTSYFSLIAENEESKPNVIRGKIKELFRSWERIDNIDIKFLPEDMYGGEQ